MEQEKPQCRTCLKRLGKKDIMLPVYRISSLLMSYTSLQIAENDGLPSNVCSSCHTRANQAYTFKMLCEESDEKLRSKLGEIEKLSSGIEAVEVKEEDSSDSIVLVSSFDEEESSLGGFSNILLEHTTDNMIELTKPDLQLSPKDELNESDEHKEISVVNQILKTEKVSDSKSNEQNVDYQNDKKKKLNCRFCDMTFTHEARLLRHEIKHENGIKCYICERFYPTLKQLRSHINIHNRKGAHLCQICGKQFTMPENLVRHQRIHTGVRPYKCKLCNKSFTQSNELKSHLITHSTEKTHLCNVCGNKYARRMSLQVHMRRLHSDASTKRPYGCDICGRAFKDKRDLSQHISIHKGERKHECKICGKAFNRSSNLKVHERIHTGCRPFVCHICQRSFIQKHVLNTHLRTHPST